jgi:amidohydrolase
LTGTHRIAPFMDDLLNGLRVAVSAETDQAVALRRAIHSHPELGHTELRTTAAVSAHLEAAGLQPVVRAESVGLHVDIGSGGPVVAFRADLDALPIDEKSGVPFASEIPGVMHACGHDAHTAIAAGLARALARLELPGTIRVIFQPAEETVPGGAVALVGEGVVDGVNSILAFHVDPSMPPGTVGIREGAITGASDRVRVEIAGPGGHTSRPHQTTDLVLAAARVVTELPQLVQRSTDPRDPIVLVFGRISGGVAENVIPTLIEIAGTVRMFDLDLWRSMPPLIERLVAEIVAPLGATAVVDYKRGSPPVINDPTVITAVARAATSILGPEGVLPTEQSLGAEDFAWYLEEVPGALVRLGAALPGRSVDLHSAEFDLDERAIPTGMMVGGAALLALLDEAG